MGDSLTDRLKAEGLRLGLSAVAIAPAVAPPGHPRFLDWLDRGYGDGMGYLRDQAAARAHPDRILPGVRSVIVALQSYGQPGPPSESPGNGRIARYAQGLDYHELLWRRLETLLAWLQAERPGTTGRAVADSAPLLERDFARMAGLGWIGKNTMLLNRRLGGYTFLGQLLTDAPLDPDPPQTQDHCGTCTRCLDACPTGAFSGPYQLDARRCISYWTIEHKGPMPDEAAEALHGWAFGCDICQEVCPWNRKTLAACDPALAPRPGWEEADLIGWLEADPDAFRRSLKGTALKRSGRRGLLRNVAILLGNRRAREAVPVLLGRLRDAEPVVRQAAAWALGRIGGDEARSGLRSALAGLDDPETRRAIESALAPLDRP